MRSSAWRANASSIHSVRDGSLPNAVEADRTETRTRTRGRGRGDVRYPARRDAHGRPPASRLLLDPRAGGIAERGRVGARDRAAAETTTEVPRSPIGSAHD